MYINNLEENGFINLMGPATDDDLIDLAKSIGKICPHSNGDTIFKLKPVNGQNSLKGTFSSVYGKGKFPLHTDTAHWARPTRYILMFSEKISDCPTLVYPFKAVYSMLSIEDKRDANQAVFLIKTTSAQFYCSLLFRDFGLEYIRFDPTCMVAVNLAARRIMKTLQTLMHTVTPEEIKWTGNNILIVDNWTTLHGRGNAAMADDRIIKRIYIN